MANFIKICLFCYIFAMKHTHVNMSIAHQILDYAMMKDGLIKRRELLEVLCSGTNGISEKSIDIILNRMAANRLITRISHGTYLVLDEKTRFIYTPDETERNLCRHIKEHYPFVDYCIWSSSVLTPLMQHVPASRIILVDVERVAMESVFQSLQGLGLDMPILLNPTRLECMRYITNDITIIVRLLVKEAPATEIDGCHLPTIEKILVDAVSDNELSFMQGNEIHTIYANASSSYFINIHRLLRYASRRNRKDKVERILKNIEYDTSGK